MDDYMMIYIDDILVYSRRAEEDARHIEVVIRKLRDNKLYANVKNNDFA
jgi:hypothetical protein